MREMSPTSIDPAALALDPPDKESSDAAIHRLSLRFSRSDLEEQFLGDYARRFLLQVRTSLLLAAALYAVFGALDPYIIPEATSFSYLVRYAVVCPMISLAFLLTWSPRFHRHSQATLAGIGFLAGVGIIAMIAHAAAPGKSLYYAGLMLVCMYIYTFFRLRFVVATIAAWTVVLIYEIAVFWSGDVPTPVIVNNFFFLAAVNVIGMFACYSMEHSVRVDYLQKRFIRQQAAALRRALGDIKTLRGFLPICAWCKKVRDDRGYWNQIERYVAEHSEATFTHGICPECAEQINAESRPPSTNASPGRRMP